jgi:hypothetical protein
MSDKKQNNYLRHLAHGRRLQCASILETVVKDAVEPEEHEKVGVTVPWMI